ncbi:MAG: MopE-related protein [Myxococcota bacterium]
MQYRAVGFLLVFVACLSLSACSDDSGGSGERDCGLGEVYNPIDNVCEPEVRGGDDSGSDAASDGASEDASEGDAGPDTADAGETDTAEDEDASDDSGTDNDTGDCPDDDGDGYLAQRCGGDDCDDANPAVNPGRPEICDDLDNNCSGEVNDGLTCGFYAHTSSDLYIVDPFQKTASPVTSVPGLFDIDTHPNGTLYGITSSSLYTFDDASDDWNLVGSLGTPATTTPNGLAIDTRGTAYMTASNNVYTVDLATGDSTLIGSMGSGYNSSGDCVINKDDTLFMSSNHALQGDVLILIDTTDASGREVGQTSFNEIYGLTAAWGRMYGLTGAGQLIEIDSGTGQATLVHTFAGKSWYGAASTPNR